MCLGDPNVSVPVIPVLDKIRIVQFRLVGGKTMGSFEVPQNEP